MPLEEPFVPAEWYRLADQDIQRAKILLREDDYSGAGFFLQQCIEKYLKGFLLSKGWRLRKIHDLSELLNEAVVHLPALELFRKECHRMSRYYVVERYPSDENMELTRTELEKALGQTVAFIKSIQESG